MTEKLKTGLKRTIIKVILSSIVFAAVISVTTIFIERYEWMTLVSAPLLLLLNLLASLITAWAVQKSDKMKFKKVVNAKNIIALLIILVLILGIYFAIFDIANFYAQYYYIGKGLDNANAQSSVVPNGKMCNAGITTICITPEGNIQPCCV